MVSKIKRSIQGNLVDSPVVTRQLALDWYKGTTLASEKRCILAKEIDFKDNHEKQTVFVKRFLK